MLFCLAKRFSYTQTSLTTIEGFFVLKLCQHQLHKSIPSLCGDSPSAWSTAQGCPASLVPCLGIILPCGTNSCGGHAASRVESPLLGSAARQASLTAWVLDQGSLSVCLVLARREEKSQDDENHVGWQFWKIHVLECPKLRFITCLLPPVRCSYIRFRSV